MGLQVSEVGAAGWGLYRSIWPPYFVRGVSGVRQPSGERCHHAVTIIISPSLLLMTCKLIKKRQRRERFPRFFFFLLSAPSIHGPFITRRPVCPSGLPPALHDDGTGHQGVMGKLKSHRQCLYKLSATQRRSGASSAPEMNEKIICTVCFIKGNHFSQI